MRQGMQDDNNQERGVNTLNSAGSISNQAVNQHVGGNVYNGPVYNNHDSSSSASARGSQGPAATVPESNNLQNLMNSLVFQRMNTRLRNIAIAHPQTRKWLFDHTTFQAWTSDDVSEHMERNQILWIKGKPGCGKSVTMKTILRWMRINRPHDVTACYFFNARASEMLEQSSLGLYRSLTHQLLEAFSYIRGSFVEQFASGIENDGKTEDWTVVELQDFLYHAISDVCGRDRRLVLFIDALDEGDELDVRPMISFLEDLMSNVSESNRLRICLSSRHYPHISLSRHLAIVMEDELGHKRDIVTYVQTKLVLDRADVDDVGAKVCEGSSGVFLWVVLVVPILKRAYDQGGGITAMSKCLAEIPRELNDLFAGILKKNEEDIEDCVSLCQWVLFAKRPLHPYELFYAVRSRTTVSESNGKWLLNELSDTMVHLYLLNTSRGLVEISNSDPPTVQFIHETVQEYLEGGGLVRIAPHLDGMVIGTSHNKLKGDCLRCIETHPDTFRGYTLGEDEEATMARSTGEHDLLYYAVDNMLNHAEVAEKHGISQKEFLRHLDAERKLCIKLSKGYEYFINFPVHRDFWDKLDVQLTSLMAEQGFEHLMRALLSCESVSIAAVEERYRDELHMAIRQGQPNIVRLLIEQGADLNAEAGLHGTPLQVALCWGRRDIAVMLIENGARLNAQEQIDDAYTPTDAAQLLRDYDESVWAMPFFDENDAASVHGSHSDVSAIRKETVSQIAARLMIKAEQSRRIGR